MFRRLLITFAITAALATVVVSGAPTTRLIATPPSTLVLDGSSNVRDWSCRGTTVDGQMIIAAPIDRINAVLDRIEDGNIAVWMSRPELGTFPKPQFTLRIPIAALRCGNRMMERDMNRALRSNTYPAIEFQFKELRSGVEHDIDRNAYTIRVAGELTLAGTQREVEVIIRVERISRDAFRIQAELPLRMTDFGVDPPTALFGMVKARDQLRVRFNLTLSVAS